MRRLHSPKVTVPRLETEAVSLDDGADVNQPQASPRLRATVIAVAAIVLLSGLGSVDASAPDEPRYLQVAEEMRSMEHGAGGLLLLHLNGEVYTQKPPLYYWLAALFGLPTHRVTELAARLPSALAGIAVIWSVLYLGSRLFGGFTGVLGAALLLSVFEFGHLARRVQLDVLLTLFETGALVAFWWLDRRIGSRRWHLTLMHGALGLALLTKGPVGLLIPFLVILAYLLWEGRAREITRLFLSWRLLLSLGPALCWIAAALALAPTGFAADAVGTNLIGRFFEGTSHARPVYYYLYQFPLDFMPWTLLWPIAYMVGRRQVFAAAEAVRDPETQRAWRFLLSWVAVSLVFFTVSSGKRGLYLLPAFPAMALICADSLVRTLSGRARLPRPLIAGAALVALLLVGVALEAVLAGLTGSGIALPDPMLAAVRSPLLASFGLTVIAALAGACAAWILLARNRTSVIYFSFVAIAAALAVELSVFLLLYPALEPISSPRPIALSAASITEPGDPIGLVGDRAMIGGLAYYADRRIAPLSTPESVRQFVDAGGKAIVVKARKVKRVEEVTSFEIASRFRTGRREVLVVVPERDSGDAARGVLRRE
jgi:4-amino-4-deoxy-L-arabinose transferase-like glycosyltransferase